MIGTTLITLQALGALVGAFGVVWAELSYVHAARDGIINHAERAHLKVIAHVLRFGMLILLLSSMGIVVYSYVYGAPQPALTSSYWAQTALVLLIIYASWALSKKRISYILGSAVVFSGWWFLSFLEFGRLSQSSFGDLVATYTVFAGLFCAVLWYTRHLSTPHTSHSL